MSVRASVSVPASGFVLEQLLAERPVSCLRMDRIAAFDGALVPYLWVIGTDIDAIERGLRSDPAVDAFEVVDTFDGETLLRIEWGPDTDALIEGLAESNAVLIDATSSGHSWSLELRFPDHDRLSEFHGWCLDHGIDISVEEVYRSNGSRANDGPLTDVQRETLYVAFESGYFEVPRNVTLSELADDLGVSDNAVSQRLRRAVSVLVARELSGTESDS